MHVPTPIGNICSYKICLSFSIIDCIIKLTKTFFGPNFFLTQKFFKPKIFLVQKFISTKFFYNPKLPGLEMLLDQTFSSDLKSGFKFFCQTPVPSPDFSLWTRSWLCFTPVTTTRSERTRRRRRAPIKIFQKGKDFALTEVWHWLKTKSCWLIIFWTNNLFWTKIDFEFKI